MQHYRDIHHCPAVAILCNLYTNQKLLVYPRENIGTLVKTEENKGITVTDSKLEQDIKEIRIDPIVPTESVLVSTVRSQRPQRKEALAPRDTRPHVDTCPFCQGNEHMTPPEIISYSLDNPWDIRIVENLYPVLSDDRVGDSTSEGLRQSIDGYGRHEVIIDHSQHGITLHEMSEQHLATLFAAYQERIKQLYETDPRLRYVLTFKNFGPAAGASIPHTHSQLIALPVVPENVQAEVQFSHTYFRKHHSCIFCALLDDANPVTATVFNKDSGESHRSLSAHNYVIEKGEHFVAIKPFASRFEWEVHIYPIHHQSDYLDVEKPLFNDLAMVIKRTMKRLDIILGGTQYNYFLHSVPHNTGSHDYSESYHWHLEICPRTSIPSGFELGSGLFVNTVSPELAAQQLRSVQLDDDG